MRARLLLASALLLLLAFVAVLAETGTGNSGQGPAHRSSPAARDDGPAPASSRIAFVVSLKMRRRALDREFDAVTDPRSRSYGRTLSPAAIGRRFGLPREALARLQRELRNRGITVIRSYPQRTAIDAVATVATLSRTFHVPFRTYIEPNGARYEAPAGEPRVPAAVSRWVDGVVGLSTKPLPFPQDIRNGALTPVDAALAYDIAPLRNSGIDGTGTTIAITSFQRFGDSDVTDFARQFSLPGTAPQHVSVKSGVSGGGVDEDDLDVEVIHGIAPGARILNYEAPKTDAGELAMLNLLATGPATIASDSWGLCDSGVGRAERTAVSNALRAVALHGTTLFVASGDSGAYDCQQSNFADHRLTVDFPSDDPNVVSVGGTTLAVRTDGTYLAESAWEDPLDYAGGGGGVNRFAAAPSWQAVHHVGDGKHRALPDVSADANPDSGWAVVVDGHSTVIGGTSAATPFWAASMLLATQYANPQGGKKSCFLAPVLYQLAYTTQPYQAFHDVSTGGNRYFSAARGWDYASGLGSPDVFNLARDLSAGAGANGSLC